MALILTDQGRRQPLTAISAHHGAVHARRQIADQLRQYFAAAIEAFCTDQLSIIGEEARTDQLSIIDREARTVLPAALTPAAAAKLTVAQLRSLLRRSGRIRNIDAQAKDCGASSALNNGPLWNTPRAMWWLRSKLASRPRPGCE